MSARDERCPALSAPTRAVTLVHDLMRASISTFLQRGLLLLLAAAACTNHAAPPNEPPSPEPSVVDQGANFATPPTTPDTAPDAAAPLDPALSARVRERFGEPCRLERACGELLGVDCDAAVDGPYYYVRRSDLEIVARCGGHCMGGRCTNCPPVEWTCATY